MKTSLALAKKYSLFILLFPFAAHADSRVENGTVVGPSESINQSVALMKFSGAKCSASFLTSKVLVTAGHCTSGAKGKAVTINVRDSEGHWHSLPVKKITTHPQFEMQTTNLGAMIKNDVGVLELAKEFSFPVRPLKIGGVDFIRHADVDVTVAGYGLNNSNGGSGKLRSGTMNAHIKPSFNFHSREGIFMVPVNEQVVCPGDSGGAVLKGSPDSTTLIGVNSISNGCQGAAGKAYSVSEILISYKSWIQTVAPTVP
jgi:secreted trypsin-like serine protease